METLIEEKQDIIEPETTPKSLQESVYDNVLDLLQTESETKEGDLYDKFLKQIEVPLFKAALERTNHNQSQAAVMLGLSRGTLRKKLKRYELI